MLAWSSELQAKATQKDLEETEGDEEKLTREEKLINHQNRIIGELIAMNRALTDRVNLLEHAGGVGQADISSTPPANASQTREFIRRVPPSRRLAEARHSLKVLRSFDSSGMRRPQDSGMCAEIAKRNLLTSRL
ncbi:hypothetical protein PI125_g26766 [Phytophthora idaei]|nr:hypothetical protein PI125_g26766 [Phytophthora idaei]